MNVRDACLWGSGYLAGALLATAACLACGWLDRRNDPYPAPNPT